MKPSFHDEAVEQAAADWLTRREAGLSGAEEQAFAAWRAADPRHEAAWTQANATRAVFDRARQRGASDVIVTRLAVRARRRRRRWRAAGLAGIGAVALALATFVWRGNVAAPAPLADAPMAALAAGSIRKLPDGSLVELNAGAEIDVRYDADFRCVQLVRGEAHFSVQKDAVRPFVVEASGVAVQAVGTAFTVHLQSSAVEVVVAEGTIALDRVSNDSAAPTAPTAPAAAIPPNDATTPTALTSAPRTLVAAGNRAFVSLAAASASAAASVPAIEAMTEAQLDARLAWRKPRLEFDSTELKQAIAMLNRYNRLQIVAGDEATARVRISGAFLADNPEGFVRIVEATFDLEARRSGENEIVLRAGVGR